VRVPGPPRARVLWPALVLGLGGAFAFSMWAGALRLPWSEVLWILAGGPAASPTHGAIVMRVRLPRALLAALVGASLGSAGGAFQALLRNPLADPYILGVSGGAALGAVAALSLGATSALAVPAAAFAGAVASMGFVYVVARAHRGSPHTLILAGVMVGSFCSALLLFLLWAAPADPARAAVFWLAGDLSGADPGWLPAAAAWASVAFAGLWAQSAALDLLTQGEDVAADLGLDVGRARLLLLACGGGLVAASVALAGLVGFVGLVVPHAVRALWGPAHRRLLPASAALGAAFLLVADGVSRTVLAPAEVPVGVITALVGAPFFLYLLRQREGRP